VRYIIKSRLGMYLRRDGGWCLERTHSQLYSTTSLDEARRRCDEPRARVVRLLTREEGKRRAKAEVLRELAAADRETGETWVTEWLEERADDLWPAPKRKADRRGTTSAPKREDA